MKVEFKVIGKNSKAIAEIHKQFTESRKGLNALMLNRLMIISKDDAGATIKLRDKNLARFINSEDVVSRIKAGFPGEYEEGIDYEIEVLK